MFFSAILVVSALASLSIASPLLSRHNQFCSPELQGRSVSIETGAFGPKAAWAFDNGSPPGEGSPVVTAFFRNLKPPQFKVDLTGNTGPTYSIRCVSPPYADVSSC